MTAVNSIANTGVDDHHTMVALFTSQIWTLHKTVIIV
jgi:hypothetical protein